MCNLLIIDTSRQISDGVGGRLVRIAAVGCGDSDRPGDRWSLKSKIHKRRVSSSQSLTCWLGALSPYNEQTWRIITSTGAGARFNNKLVLLVKMLMGWERGLMGMRWARYSLSRAELGKSRKLPPFSRLNCNWRYKINCLQIMHLVPCYG